MLLYAAQFFAEHLALPFDNAVVVGNSYYASPSPGSPLRLRIDFAPTLRHGEYDGLRLRVLHPEQGTIDTAILTFADHDTFTLRDTRRQIGPGADGYARIRDWHHDGIAPWAGADASGLRRAIMQYVPVWFPGAAATNTTPRPVQARTAQPVPSGPASATSASRTR